MQALFAEVLEPNGLREIFDKGLADENRNVHPFWRETSRPSAPGTTRRPGLTASSTGSPGRGTNRVAIRAGTPGSPRS